MVRRWRVVIEDIEITNRSPRMINPFIRFTIGGNYYVSSTYLLILVELLIRFISKKWQIRVRSIYHQEIRALFK